MKLKPNPTNVILACANGDQSSSTLEENPVCPTVQGQGCDRSSQWGNPTGWAGRIVGHLMAAKNDGMNRAAIQHLDLQPEDRVLEVGFGPGKAIQTVAERTRNGFVVGLDHSPIMVHQAEKRNRRLIREGLVEIQCGSVSHIPYADGSFDKAFAVNSFQFWPAPQDDLLEIHRVLRPGRTLVLTTVSCTKRCPSSPMRESEVFG